MNKSISKTNLLGLLLLIALAMLAYWALRDGKSPAVPEAEFIESGPWRIAVSTDPERPRVGKNKIRIQLRDRENNPVKGAQVRALAEMPAMGAMPVMRAQAEIAETASGSYEGEFELSMEGAWPLALEIIARGERARLSFDMATGRAGLRLAAGGRAAGSVGEAESGAILVDARRRQAIGVKIGTVERKPFAVPLRLQGKITYDETRLSDITLRFDGWIGELDADFEGKQVARGDILFTVYSPELLSLQEEYLQALKRGGALQNAARKRLKLWGLSEQQIDWLREQKTARDYVPIFASTSGAIIEKNIVAGSAYKKGQRLLRLADLRRVWVEAFAYEQDLPLIKTGMPAQVDLPNHYNGELAAEVIQVDPFLQSGTRAARVRLALDNREGQFQPGTFADITLRAELGNLLLVPEDAVLIAGRKRIVFRDLGEGRLKPVEVRTGYSDGKNIVVRNGLNQGDRIVTSGVFLIAAESKLKAGLEQW